MPRPPLCLWVRRAGYWEQGFLSVLCCGLFPWASEGGYSESFLPHSWPACIPVSCHLELLLVSYSTIVGVRNKVIPVW